MLPLLLERDFLFPTNTGNFSHSHLKNHRCRPGGAEASGVISALQLSSPIEENRPMRIIRKIRSDAPVETVIRPVPEVAINLVHVHAHHRKTLAYLFSEMAE
jgi:hypothetical protein